MMDRPFNPPGAEIAAQACDAFATWENRYSDELDGLDTSERAAVYSYMHDGVDIDLAKAMAASDAR